MEQGWNEGRISVGRMWDRRWIDDGTRMEQGWNKDGTNGGFRAVDCGLAHAHEDGPRKEREPNMGRTRFGSRYVTCRNYDGIHYQLSAEPGLKQASRKD